MPEVEPKESRSQGEGSGSFDMQTMIAMMQQMLQKSLE
jgi:hypothetical protein